MKINNNLYSLDAVDLAKKLLGKILVRNINGIEIETKIVEVEAYNGAADKANHAFVWYCKGKKSKYWLCQRVLR